MKPPSKLEQLKNYQAVVTNINASIELFLKTGLWMEPRNCDKSRIAGGYDALAHARQVSKDRNIPWIPVVDPLHLSSFNYYQITFPRQRRTEKLIAGLLIQSELGPKHINSHHLVSGQILHQSTDKEFRFFMNEEKFEEFVKLGTAAPAWRLTMRTPIQ